MTRRERKELMGWRGVEVIRKSDQENLSKDMNLNWDLNNTEEPGWKPNGAQCPWQKEEKV